MENENPATIEINKLTAIVFPNPHRGSFNIKIASPESGSATIELFTASGQKLAVKNVAVQKGDNNIIPFSSIRQGTIFYRVHVGKQSANGKVIGME